MRLFSCKIFENIVAAFTFVSRLALLHCYRLTGRRTEKDGNLAIWSRREHKKRTSGRIKVVTMLDEISSFFVYHPPRRHISQYFPPFFSSPRKLFTSVANYLDANGSAKSIRRTLKQTPNRQISLLSRITMMFFSLRTDFSVESLNILPI